MVTASVALAKRVLRGLLRRTQFLAPLIVFPSLLLAVNAAGLERSTNLPGFPPVDSFLDFQLSATIVQAQLLGGISAGIAVALEIEGGFFDRLVLAPIPRTAVVFGRLLATAVVAAILVVFFLTVGFIFGAHIESGILGFLCMLVIGVTAGVGFGAIGVAIALRARSAATVQGIFPLVFVLLFASSAFFPIDLLSPPASWIADFNPLSYIADGMRDPMISTISWDKVLAGFAAAAGVAAVAIYASLAALRGRLRDA